MSLVPIFERLTGSRSNLPEACFLVEILEGPRQKLIACSHDGRPGLFIAVGQQGESPGIRLRNLEVRHRMTGNLRTADGNSVQGTYTLVECLTYDARLHRSFLDMVSEILSSHPVWDSTEELEQAFSTLVDLFTAASHASTSSWLGTWGELFLIHRATHMEELLACWHVDPMKLHDFALNTDRLECKCTTAQVRAHEFSLQQLEQNERTVYIASIVTHENFGGVSALDLFDEIRDKVQRHDLRTHLDKVVAEMLGESVTANVAPRYDYNEALVSFRLLKADSVPRPTNPYPDVVDSIRFRANVSGCPEAFEDSQLLRLLL